MKKSFIVLLMLITAISMIGFSSAITYNNCDVKVSLYNQDPYPAIQGEYVKLVFKVEGLQLSSCGNVYVGLLEDFPIQFDPGANKSTVLNSGEYLSDYSNYALIPFKVRVDENALDSEYELKLNIATNYGSRDNVFITKKVNFSVQESKTDFEITIKDYDAAKQIATFDIINIGKKNVESLVVDAPKQEGFVVKGSTRSIIGSLDANDDTTFTFEGVPKDGPIDFKISYNDDQGIRRTSEKKIMYDSGYFTGRVKDIVKPNYTGVIIIGIIILIIVYVIVSRFLKRRRIEKMRNARK